MGQGRIGLPVNQGANRLNTMEVICRSELKELMAVILLPVFLFSFGSIPQANAANYAYIAQNTICQKT